MLDLATLRSRLAEIGKHSPRLVAQLMGANPADFASAPLLRKSDLPTLQRAAPPFAGVAVSTKRFKRLFMSPGPIFEGEDHGEDAYGAKAAFVAAGFLSGDVVVNCFSYHLTPSAFVMESGAHAVGCAVIPAGPGNIEQTLTAVAHLKANAYVGSPDLLKILLDKAGGRTSIRKALVSGAALPPSLRAELEARGVKVRQMFGTAEVGVIAYETDAPDGTLAPGMKVADDVYLEIVRPGSGDPVAAGQVGEIVVTALRGGFPLLRFATGDLSAFLETDRIKGWMGRADQTTKVKGIFVHPSAVVEVARRHRELKAVRLVVRREDEQDAMTLLAETEASSSGLAEAVAASLLAVTKLRGVVQFMPPGSLPNDGKTIADERPAP
jgi:phenylacetate-CoA ligase